MQKEQFGPLALMAALWRKDYPAIASHAHIHDIPQDNIEELTRIVGERTRPIGTAAAFGNVGEYRPRHITCYGDRFADVICGLAGGP